MPLPEREPIILEPDPVIEYFKQFVDREAIRPDLKLTVEERVKKLMALQDDALANRYPCTASSG